MINNNKINEFTVIPAVGTNNKSGSTTKYN